MSLASGINAGSRITAAMIRNIAPLSAFKTADEVLASSTTLQNDDVLAIAVQANSTYKFILDIDYEGGTLASSDFKWGWTFPTGTTMRYHSWFLGTGATVQLGVIKIQTDVTTAGSAGAGVLRAVTMSGTVTVAGTAGNLQLQWAQGTSNAVATVVHAGSALSAWQIA